MPIRLVGRPLADIDLVLFRTADRIVRSEGALWVHAAEASMVTLRRELALAGLGVREEEAPAPRPDLVPSLGLSLEPATEPAIEILSLRRMSLAESTARTLGRRSLWRLLPAYRARHEQACRELLRGLDELAWWERRAWLGIGAVRLPAVRRSFRPIVFDREALASLRFGGVVHARDGAISRWAFG